MLLAQPKYTLSSELEAKQAVVSHTAASLARRGTYLSSLVQFIV